VETEAGLWEGLFSRDVTTTVLAVSHRRPALTRAGTVLVMDDGKVVAAGKAADLLRTSPLFREMWAED
jgi:ATP-binding cassette subfamily B multidrug efflux pump